MVISPFIAVLGGSFDPVHNGHIQLAEIVSQHIEHVEVYFVPCGNPVHRAPLQASAHDRIEMVKLAIAGHEHWHIDTYEVERTEPSYTLDTLKHFRQRFPNNPMGFMMGMDSFLSIETWGNWQELLDYANLLVVPRKGYHNSDKNNDRITILPVAPRSVSSTEIRKKLSTRDDVSSLLPRAVYDYIQQHKLYL